MAVFTEEFAENIQAACEAGTAEAAKAIARALDFSPEILVGAAGPFDPEQPGASFRGPGLLLAVAAEGEAVVLALPEASGLLPDWAAEPDAAGKRKLTTLAQELGAALLPADIAPDDHLAGPCRDLAGAIAAGAFTPGAGVVPLSLTVGDRSATFALAWGAQNPQAMFLSEEEGDEADDHPPADAFAREDDFSDFHFKGDIPPPPTYQDLPPYGKSLLRIKVPVIVTLARKKEQVGRIVDLAPGSLIQFDKSCEETLDLEVADQRVAEGEAVKVGDKFGLRLTSMTLPGERFFAVRGRRDA